MKLSKLSVKRPVTALMMTLVIVLLGVVAMTNLQMDLFPDVNLPYAVVSTSYSGAGPEEVENIVTRNIETAMASVSNIKTISSTSSEGSSVVILEFSQDTDMDSVMLEINERLDMVTPYLPDEVSAPVFIKFDVNMIPMMGYSVSFDDGDAWATTRWAEDILKPRLEKIEGVASVSINGGVEREIRITPDKDEMEALGISGQMISQMIGANNLNLPAGTVSDEEAEYSVRTLGAFESVEDIENLVFFSTTQMKSVKLSDFASVSYEDINTKTYSKVNGRDSITINLQKQSDYNTVEVAQSVKDEIRLIEEEYETASFTVTLDQSEYTRMMVRNVGLNALIGAILAIIVLFIFLKDIRPTFIIGVAIPISVLAAFVMIYFAGITLNIVSMGGLALGIGMLVDNAIVVIENIYRLRSEGRGMKKAAIKGAGTIAGAITASTLTTVSVFLPVVFLTGFTADIFREMALTVSISLLASLFIALTLVPMIASKTLRADTSGHHRLMAGITSIYKKLLGWSLKRRAVVLILAIAVFGGSVYGVLQMGMEYFPESDMGQLSIEVELPKGSGFTDTVSIVEQVEEKLFAYEEVETVSAGVMSSGGTFGFGGAGGSDSGSITVVLKSKSERGISTREFADKVREGLSSIEGADISVSAMNTAAMSFFGGSSVTVEIQGEDLDVLHRTAMDFKDIFLDIDGITEAETSINVGSPEIRIIPDNARMAMHGLTTYQVANTVSGTIQGIRATTVRLDNNDITVRLMEATEYSVDTLSDIPISTPTGSQTTLGDVADISFSEGYTSINRESQRRIVSVTGTLAEGYDPGSVGRDIQAEIDSYEHDDAYSIKLAGTNEEIIEAFDSLLFALGIGVLLVYMIMSAQFESLVHPFIILFAIPFAFTGAFLGLLITGNPLSVPAFIGMIVLAGIVVNNGIVLVDYINRLRAEGMNIAKAIMTAGPVRLRPILMTVVTTILALVPLALGLGEGTEMTVPLAVTVIGGLVFSTVLTLIVVPVLYSFLGGKTSKSKKSKSPSSGGGRS